ncbi:thiamine pyrophosphokinase-related protein [Diaporthe amygdali]|uniref:thiamine pyrophosphokinase-related protein n=1 Tax=Phomopsis amygdali TaxID=1214568 RepID=UPI0022FF1B67|nr:thiamine pyrophosphokinase-related protein [Diaporthe amygdali]KAJ0114568.1 thiamine pyrophosphokinase-related protein [Diaporthe amygdali]
MIHWSRHSRFSIHRESKANCLDAKHDTAQSPDVNSKGSMLLGALIMELLAYGGIPELLRPHRKGDRSQILSSQSGIAIDRRAVHLFQLVTTDGHIPYQT